MFISEVPVRLEDTETPSVKIEVDEVPHRMETVDMAFRTEETDVSVNMEESGEVPPFGKFFELPCNIENDKVLVKSEDDVFVKMEEIDEKPCLLDSW